LAEASERAGKPDEAKQLYDKALAQKPDYLPALLGSARLLDREGKLDQAVASYQKTLVKHPQEGTVYNDLGLCLQRQGKVTEALNCFQQAVRLQPDKKLFRNNYAAALVQANRPSEAFQQLVAVHPEAVAHYNLGCMLARAGNEPSAVAAFQQALSVDRSLTAAQDWLTRINSSHQQESPYHPAPTLPEQTASVNEREDATSTLVIRTDRTVPSEEKMVARAARSTYTTESPQMNEDTAPPSRPQAQAPAENPLRQNSEFNSRSSLRAAVEPKAAPPAAVKAEEPKLDWSKPPEEPAAPVAPLPPIQMPGNEPEKTSPPATVASPVRAPTRNIDVEYPSSSPISPRGADALPPTPNRYYGG
jgi:Tfp pilus assembly protein PilF